MAYERKYQIFTYLIKKAATQLYAIVYIFIGSETNALVHTLEIPIRMLWHLTNEKETL